MHSKEGCRPNLPLAGSLARPGRTEPPGAGKAFSKCRLRSKKLRHKARHKLLNSLFRTGLAGRVAEMAGEAGREIGGVGVADLVGDFRHGAHLPDQQLMRPG